MSNVSGYRTAKDSQKAAQEVCGNFKEITEDSLISENLENKLEERRVFTVFKGEIEFRILFTILLYIYINRRGLTLLADCNIVK